MKLTTSIDKLMNSVGVLILSIWLTTLASCGGVDTPSEAVAYQMYLPDSNREKAAAFISRTVSSANPNVDDPEESIEEASRAAIQIYGVRTIGIDTWRNGQGGFIPYHECSPRQRALCDEFMKSGDQ